MNIQPRMSIGLPVYNGEAFLREAVDSLLAQTFKDFELIISDNASIDGTMLICREYAAKDTRVKYYRQDINQGPVWNFNFVVDRARADYFMWASHDDYWRPTYIEKCMAALQSSSLIMLACADSETQDRDTGKIVGRTALVSIMGVAVNGRLQQLKLMMYKEGLGCYFYGIFRLKKLKECLPLKNCIATDDILLSELSFLGDFVVVPELLLVKRNKGTSKTASNVARVLKIKNTFSVHSPDFFRELLFQKLLIIRKELNWHQKVYLSCWTWVVYGVSRLKRVYWVLRDSYFRPLRKFLMARGTA